MNKTMEKEYKWRADEYLLGQALLWASSRIGSQSRTIHMQSQYFDTPDGLLRQQQGALRLRRENDRSVCCLKLRNENTPGGMRAHEEYQCDAQTVQEGLRALPDKGAPRDLCEQALSAPLCEIELEYVAGGEQAFHDLAAELAGHLSLVPEPESKLARAMKL